MPKNSSPIRRGSALATRTVPSLGAGAVVGGAALAGHPIIGAVVAAAIVAGQVAVEIVRVRTQRQVARAAAEIARNSDEDAVKRIGALTELIEKLR